MNEQQQTLENIINIINSEKLNANQVANILETIYESYDNYCIAVATEQNNNIVSLKEWLQYFTNGIREAARQQ